MAREPRECKECRNLRPIHGQGLCARCYKRYFASGRLDKQRYDICVDCKEYVPIFGVNRCKKCHQKWYKSHPENKKKHAEQMNRARKEKPEIYQAIERRRQQTDKRHQYQLDYNRKYYAKNAEQLKKYQSDWRKSNPKQRDEYKRRRRARAANLPDTLTLSEWKQILEKYNYSCAYCGDGEEGLVKEHWIPASLGGGYTKYNIVPSCASCNSRKGTMTGDEFMAMLSREKT